jgi:AmmeMemoRadiSam system protein A
VTLHLGKQLRGCIGSLQGYQPLIVDVAMNAFNAAFRDPRFLPMTESELPKISLDISVLSKSQPMHFSSEADLLSQLRPGIDGLIISDHGHRGTFLPSVWEQLPDPATFLSHLKTKAGLPTNYWSNTLTVQRYTTELIS